jgi:hypothetical protein
MACKTWQRQQLLNQNFATQFKKKLWHGFSAKKQTQLLTLGLASIF